MKNRMRLLKVLVEIPDSETEDGLRVDNLEIAHYVQDALGSWGHGGDPMDDLFNGLKVRRITIEGTLYAFAKPKEEPPCPT